MLFRRRTLTTITALALCCAPIVAARGQLPSRLTDAEFWQLITAWSEPAGHFQSENYVSNELAYQHVIPSLLRSRPAGDVYLGVGPEQNFTYIAALQPSLAIIVDIRRGNLLQHLLYKALFELSANRGEFLSRLFSRPGGANADTLATADALFTVLAAAGPDSARYRANRDAVWNVLTKTHGFALSSSDLADIGRIYDAFFYGGPAISYIYPAMNRGGYPAYHQLMVADDSAGSERAFLASERAWRVVKDMHARNLIVPVVGDFAGPTALRAVGVWLNERRATVGTFYVSNVEQYLFEDTDAWRRFYESVGALPVDSASMFIRSFVGRSAFMYRGVRGASMAYVVDSGLTRAQVVVRSPGPGRFATTLSPMIALLNAYRAGRITSYEDVIARE